MVQKQAAEMARYQAMPLDKLQKVEVGMLFEKKYSPIVLTKATMFCLNCAERAARFILQDEMEEFFQATIDSTAWKEDGFEYHKSEISASVMCRNGKLVPIDFQVILLKRNNGAYCIASGIDTYVLRFPGCKALRGKCVFFSVNPETSCILRFCVWEEKVSSEEGTLPTHEAMCRVRQALLS